MTAERRESVAHAPSWQSIRLANGCANLLCENKRRIVTEAVAIREGEDYPVFRSGPPMVLYVCSPCAAVLRGESL